MHLKVFGYDLEESCGSIAFVYNFLIFFFFQFSNKTIREYKKSKSGRIAQSSVLGGWKKENKAAWLRATTMTTIIEINN